MGSVVQRLVLSALVVLAIVFVANRRLSREPGRTADRTPPLWAEAVHPDVPAPRRLEGRLVSLHYPDPAVNCALMVSMDRENPYRFTPVDEGVAFDIDGDGDLDRVSWPEADSDVAFLAIDRDGDGSISSGRELVGDRTVPGAGNGLNALIALAERSSGKRSALLNIEHPLFSELSLWTDANHNGISEPDELRPVGQTLSAIGLGYQRHHRKDRHGNESRSRGFVHVRTAPGMNMPGSAEEDASRRRPLYDACLATAE